MNNYYLFVQDLRNFTQSELNSLFKYYNIPNARQDDRIWLLAVVLAQKIHKATMGNTQTLECGSGELVELRAECFKIIESLGNTLGEGHNSCIVRTVCLKDGCDYAAKFISFRGGAIVLEEDDYDPYASFNKEVQMTRFASEHDIGPKYIDSWICDDVGVIVMEKVSETLEKYAESRDIPIEIQTALLKTISRAAKARMIHGDLHYKNLSSGGKFLDFGNSEFVDDDPTLKFAFADDTRKAEILERYPTLPDLVWIQQLFDIPKVTAAIKEFQKTGPIDWSIFEEIYD